MSNLSDEGSETRPSEDSDQANCLQLVVAPPSRVRDLQLSDNSSLIGLDEGEDDDNDLKTKSLIDHAWSERVLRLVGNKARLMESFSWLSTVGGGYSSLGEQDNKFSARAGALSLGQQLRLADLLGDERLKVMCHLFAALAALQMNNKYFCLNYVRRVIMPLIHAMPYRDPIVTNILRHIYFRMSMLDKFVASRNNAIEDRRHDLGAQNLSKKGA